MALLYENKVKVNTTAFVKKVREIAAKHGLEPDWIMIVINFESGGTFSPSAKNPYSSATGLIQFIESVAKELGTTTAALAQMTNVQQLDYVDKYFGLQIRRHGHINSAADAYLSVFYPAAIAWPMSKVFPDNVYRVNKIFDLNKDGKITKQEVQDRILATIPAEYRGIVSKKKI